MIQSNGLAQAQCKSLYLTKADISIEAFPSRVNMHSLARFRFLPEAIFYFYTLERIIMHFIKFL